MADPGFANGGAKVERRRREDRGAEGAEWSSAAGASMEAPKAPREVGRGEGVSPSPLGRGLDFESENGDFWCILGAILQRNPQTAKAVSD